MKICFISPYASRGGAELSLVELVDALIPLGIQCSCIVPDHGEITQLLHDRQVETMVVPFKPWVHAPKGVVGCMLKSLPHRQLRGVSRLHSAIKRSKCDMVYTNSVAVGAGAMAAKLAGVPHVWHLREFGYDDYRLSFDLGHKFSTFLMRRLSSACIANSTAVAKAYANDLCGTPIHVVYNAAEVCVSDEAQAMDANWRNPDAIRCILLGKYMSGKGQEDAINAMLELRKMQVPAELLLVGETLDGDYRRHLEKMVVDNDLSDCVCMLGHCSAPAPLLESADVVLMCSRREAFGRVTVEGMKLGKPVIGTRTGGTPEIIDDGVTGYLYDPGDYTALAERISQFHGKPLLKARMGKAASDSAHARFNQGKYGLDILRVLQDVITFQNRSLDTRGQGANDLLSEQKSDERQIISLRWSVDASARRNAPVRQQGSADRIG